MRITQQQLRQTLDGTGSFSLLFLGMSGIGKTFWSTRLAEAYRLPRVEIDELISLSTELRDLLKDRPETTPTEQMANYFGFPWSEGFEEREGLYLSIERAVMRQDFPPGALIDLTGSAVYHPDELRRLARRGLVIHFETPPERREEMLRTFLEHPKPVCWNRYFSRRKGESEMEALRRCYASLLHYRETLYEEHADVSIPYSVHVSLDTVQALVESISSQLDLFPREEKRASIRKA